MKTIKINLLILLFFLSTTAFSQYVGWKYARSINYKNTGWNKLILSNEILDYVSKDFSDIRVLQIKNNDSIQIPFIIKIDEPASNPITQQLKVINKSSNANFNFSTLIIPQKIENATIELKFNKINFDFIISIEGSNDGNNWYKINNNQRMISFVDKSERFNYTSFLITSFAFQYLKVAIPKIANIEIDKAYLNIQKNKVLEKKNSIIKTLFFVDKQEKTTIIEGELNHVAAIDVINYRTNTKGDYYRDYTLYGYYDSTKTNTGWIKNYFHIQSGIISSFTIPAIEFKFSLIKGFKLIIKNNDNIPLNFDDFSIAGPVIKCITQNSEIDGKFLLLYGNKNALLPEYDLTNFSDKIPDTLNIALLSNEIKLINDPIQKNTTTLSSIWIWVAIIALIILLGYFTIIMIKKI